MARYLDPKSDLTFKRIFGEHPDLLTSFLNAVMPFEPGRHIEHIEYLSPELTPDILGKKDSIVDVRCNDNHNRQFIVEMQMKWIDFFYNRIVFNAGKAYVRQLDRAEDYSKLCPVYTLVILNQNFDHKTEHFYHHYRIANRENSDEIIPGLEFVLVELTSKFRPETVNHRRMMVLWLRFLKEVNENLKALPPEMHDEEPIRKAAELCEEGAYTSEELVYYDRYWDSVRIEKSFMESGRREGLAEGRAEGRIEEKTEIALNMLKDGMSVNIVCKYTGLSNLQIEELENELFKDSSK